MKKELEPTYHAFLIRLWREEANTWRGTLENAHTGKRHAFANVDLLLSHIRNQIQNDTSAEMSS